jgi:hypothetical protein
MNPQSGGEMEERQDRTEDEVPLPEDRVEDLEPDAADAEDVGGGKVPGNFKYTNITLKKGVTPD